MMRIWNWTIENAIKRSQEVLENLDKIESLRAEIELLKDEKRQLASTIEKTQEGILAVIEQRDSLAARLRGKQ